MTRFASLLGLLVVLPWPAGAACNLKMKWGLESTGNFVELSQYADEDSAVRSMTRSGPKLRAFRTSQAGSQAVQTYIGRHNNLFERYAVANPGEKRIPRAKFIAWARTNDPFYVTLGRSLAPTLYFDFTGNSGEEYVLDGVDVTTFEFHEYAGGGFFDGKAWYDIELSKTPGIRHYSAERRLRFTGSGRAELRFFSDNYYPGRAMTPQGSFTIALAFRFIRDGETCQVKTGRFMVDA